MAAPIRSAIIPARLAKLPKDPRGYPIPWFVHQTIAGHDFRVIGYGKMREALKDELCWICGGKLGDALAFVVGPMCVINLITSEPPSHLDCARFAAQNCPFLTVPEAKRDPREIPAEADAPAGLHDPRNPALCAIVRAARFTPFRVVPESSEI